MIVGDKWRRFMFRGVGKNEGRHMSQHDGGTGDNEEDLLPLLPVIIGMGAGHLPDLSPVSLSQETKPACNQ